MVAFEVIEHLPDWRDFLLEVRRVLAPTGQFIVSTPNKLYYAESRGRAGANPFHAHEFEFDEFRDELSAIFPHISLFLENHVEGVAFRPTVGAGRDHRGPRGWGRSAAGRIALLRGGLRAPPADRQSHVRLCSQRRRTCCASGRRTSRCSKASCGARTIGWRQAKRDLADLDREHRQTDGGTGGEQPLGRASGQELAASGARIQELQQELARGRAGRGRAYERKIAELEWRTARSRNGRRS